jgi:hypothetical protein
MGRLCYYVRTSRNEKQGAKEDGAVGKLNSRNVSVLYTMIHFGTYTDMMKWTEIRGLIAEKGRVISSFPLM